MQEVLDPKKTILEAVRVGKKVIAGVPNFCHLTARMQMFFGGRVPITKTLPYQWYDTPNLRFFSLKDFEIFCRSDGIKIICRKTLNFEKEVHFLPNMFAHIGIYVLEMNEDTT